MSIFKTTLYLDARTRHVLRSLALQEGRTQTLVLHDAIAQYAKSADAQGGDLPPGLGAYRSGKPNLSANTRAIVRKAAAAGGLRRSA